MEAEKLISELERLERRIQKLVDEKNKWKDRYEQASLANKALKDELVRSNDDLKGFQNQSKIRKLVTGLASDVQTKTELKSLLSEYIKEVDKCIAYLNA